jgi:hypothetical protein
MLGRGSQRPERKKQECLGLCHIHGRKGRNFVWIFLMVRLLDHPEVERSHDEIFPQEKCRVSRSGARPADGRGHRVSTVRDDDRVREHTAVTVKMQRQPFYYRRWFYCMNTEFYRFEGHGTDIGRWAGNCESRADFGSPLRAPFCQA